MMADDRCAMLSPTSPMYTHSVSRAVVAPESADGAEHGPTDAASQSPLFAPVTRQTPRSAPLVSSANSKGSFPESLIVKITPGCVWLDVAAEFSTSSGRACTLIATASGTTPIESVPRYGERRR